MRLVRVPSGATFPVHDPPPGPNRAKLALVVVKLVTVVPGVKLNAAVMNPEFASGLVFVNVIVMIFPEMPTEAEH